jgi:hypothetical protein
MSSTTGNRNLGAGMMKRLMLVLVLLMAVPAARADETTKTAKVKELFQTMHLEKLMDQLTDTVMKQVSQMTKTMPGADQITPAQQKVIDQYMVKIEAMTKESVGWNAIEPEYVKLYAATYSEEEIDAILTFYRSPAGQKMLEKTPELTQGGIRIVQARMVDFQPRMKAVQEEFLKALVAASPKAKSTTPAAK